MQVPVPRPRRRAAMPAVALALTIAACLPAVGGCSGGEKTAPETIEGKTPAEYREQAERGVVDSVPQAPKAAAGKRR